jgi:rRNA processing protein Gar1
MKHAIVDQNNVVVNIIVWEGAEWLPPRNHMVIRSDDASIGDIYDPVRNVFLKPIKQEKNQ